MKKALKFKTNIKCMGCVSAVSPALNEAVGADNWQVDLLTPDKQLTVMADDQEAETVVAAIEKAGYKAEQL